jgi:hypothetical protein
MPEITPTTVGMGDAISDQISIFKFNPSAMQRTILDNLEETTGKQIDIVDPTNPFLFLLEATCVTAAASISENLVNLRKQYPELAISDDELYNHLSDVDYVGRFALPSVANITFMIHYDDFINKSVEVPTSNYRQARIHRNTEIKVKEHIFSLQYPITIRKFDNGNLIVKYEEDITSPLETLKTGLIEHEIRKDKDGTKWIMFTVPLQQFTINTNEISVIKASGFKETINYENQYYFCRVYNKSNNTNNEWVELKTTHSDMVFNIDEPTVLLRVINNQLEVTIPDLYLLSDKITGSLRIDAYTTKGELYLPLKDAKLNEYEITYKAIDLERDTDEFTAVMPTIINVAFSNDVVHGGKMMLDFDKFKEQIIYNTVGPIELPITERQLETKADRLGYELFKAVDIVTDRYYMVSRYLPNSKLPNIPALADLTIETINATNADLLASDQVVDNNGRMTIKSNTIFRSRNSIIDILPDSERNDIINLLSPTEKANIVNSQDLYYSPYYYVLDRDNDELETRVYSLDYPEVNYINYVDNNNELEVNVNTRSYSIEKTETGYKLILTTISGDRYKTLPDNEVFVQIAIPIPDTNHFGYLTGTQIGITDNERVYEFNIDTDLNIDSKDRINFTNLTSLVFNIFADLTTDINVYYFTTSPNINAVPFYLNNEIDLTGFSLVNQQLAQVISKETMNVSFGTSLEYIWRRSRIAYNEAKYETYTTDIPMFYKKDIYKIDPETGTIFSIDENCDIDHEILHRRGDLVLNPDGTPVYEHKAGDVKLDDKGNPIINELSGVINQVDLVLVNAEFLIANSDDNIKYRDEFTALLTKWITTDLLSLNDEVLELTTIFFGPTKTSGIININISNTTTMSIEAKQRPKVSLYVSEDTAGNYELISTIKSDTASILHKEIRNTTINLTEMRNTIITQLGNNILGVKIENFNGMDDNDIISMALPNTRMSLAKRLTVNKDTTLSVEYDIEIAIVTVTY